MRKRWIAALITFQIFFLTYLWISFPFSARRVSLDTSLAPSRSSFRYISLRNVRSVRPTLLVGVFITNRTSTSRLKAFRESFKIVRPLVQFNLHYFFVLGNTTISDSNIDILHLSIHENMDEGKTFQYFLSAIDWFARQNISHHPLNGIVKMDTDTAVDWPAFSDQVLGQLEPMYYLGRRNSRSMCGNLDYCPPSDCHDFSHNCWVYMSGGWYALSLDLAKRSILNCSYAASHSVGYEDLTVGTWISHCSPEASVFHSDNGQFFCHSSFISDQHIRDMQFPRNNWLWFSKVSCLGHSGEVK